MSKIAKLSDKVWQIIHFTGYVWVSFIRFAGSRTITIILVLWQSFLKRQQKRHQNYWKLLINFFFSLKIMATAMKCNENQSPQNSRQKFEKKKTEKWFSCDPLTCVFIMITIRFLHTNESKAWHIHDQCLTQKLNKQLNNRCIFGGKDYIFIIGTFPIEFMFSVFVLSSWTNW